MIEGERKRRKGRETYLKPIIIAIKFLSKRHIYREILSPIIMFKHCSKNSVEGCSHPPPFFSPTDLIFSDFSECSNCVLPFSTFYFVTLRKWWQPPYWLIYEIFLHYRAAFKCQVCLPPFVLPSETFPDQLIAQTW